MARAPGRGDAAGAADLATSARCKPSARRSASEIEPVASSPNGKPAKHSKVRAARSSASSRGPRTHSRRSRRPRRPHKGDLAEHGKSEKKIAGDRAQALAKKGEGGESADAAGHARPRAGTPRRKMREAEKTLQEGDGPGNA